MYDHQLVSRIIVMLEKLHTVVILLVVFGWELFHLIMFLVR